MRPRSASAPHHHNSSTFEVLEAEADAQRRIFCSLPRVPWPPLLTRLRRDHVPARIRVPGAVMGLEELRAKLAAEKKRNEESVAEAMRARAQRKRDDKRREEEWREEEREAKKREEEERKRAREEIVLTLEPSLAIPITTSTASYIKILPKSLNNPQLLATQHNHHHRYSFLPTPPRFFILPSRKMCTRVLSSWLRDKRARQESLSPYERVYDVISLCCGITIDDVSMGVFIRDAV
ncbi:hypothetical protein T440DRAFT_521861 [Plenodomus tracheiphilus IPT5]|uniref:Uncharacterized protein n=1 Tax=Plenodomus tracheiphilus IPT5 TaxID=1408161 RepID=A0A6A7ASK0_9PLEO|nr:hypothetical protein T440DRAFT_521861 [Plenodomus tracheiphilus IPT5]